MWVSRSPEPMLPPRGGASPSDDRRATFGGSRVGYYDAYSDREGYSRGKSAPSDRDWDELERRRTATRGRGRSPGFEDGVASCGLVLKSTLIYMTRRASKEAGVVVSV
jgi:hypothetical protein